MFEISVLKTQYILIALGGGAVVVIMVILTYLAIWRPRFANEEGEPAAPVPGIRGVWKAMPWVLLLTYIATLGYGVIFAIAKILNPPNW